MAEQYFLGIDIGSSSARAALFNSSGALKDLSFQEYRAECPAPGCVEINPDLVFDAVVKVVRACVAAANVPAHSIVAACIGSQMHTLLPVDAQGQPLFNALTYADTRADEEARFITDRFDAHRLYSRTGCCIQHPMYPLSKLLWFRNHQKNVFDAAARFVSLKDYVVFKLFNRWVTDMTNASASGLYNTHEHRWDEDILASICGITDNKLPEVVPCLYPLRGMQVEYAAAMGLSSEMPVIAGSGDGMLAHIGGGAVFDAKCVSSTIGTSGAIRIVSSKPLLDDEMRTWCYCLDENRWIAGGAISNGGLALRKLRDEFRAQFEREAAEHDFDNVYSLFDQYAGQIQPGCDGLLVIPTLTGERSPDWNPHTKGAVIGLTLAHDKRHLVRATMEGVMFRMFSVFEALDELSPGINRIIAGGGYAQSQTWLQIQADIFHREIRVPAMGEASLLGSVYLAMAGIGAVNAYEKPLPGMQTRHTVTPHPEHCKLYETLCNRYQRVYKFLNNEDTPE